MPNIRIAAAGAILIAMVGTAAAQSDTSQAQSEEPGKPVSLLQMLFRSNSPQAPADAAATQRHGHTGRRQKCLHVPRSCTNTGTVAGTCTENLTRLKTTKPQPRHRTHKALPHRRTPTLPSDANGVAAAQTGTRNVCRAGNSVPARHASNRARSRGAERDGGRWSNRANLVAGRDQCARSCRRQLRLQCAASTG